MIALSLILIVVAFILSILELVRSKLGSVVAWAVLLLSLALLIPHLVAR